MVPARAKLGKPLTDLAILLFCEEELVRRARKDSEDVWFWQGKLKIARYLINSVRGHLQSDELLRIPQLTDSETEEVLRAHPLLQRTASVPILRFQTQTSQWAEDIRKKVETFIRALEAPRSENAERAVDKSRNFRANVFVWSAIPGGSAVREQFLVNFMN